MSQRKAARSGEATPLPVARIAHACPSRTRLQFPGLKGRSEPFKSLCDAVAKLSDVRQVEARPATGSLIVSHDSSTEDLIAAVNLAGLFLVEETAETHAPGFEAQLWKKRIDAFLKDTFGSALDLRAVAAFAFIAMALRQLAAGNVMPPAATALWYGLTILLTGGMPPDAGAEGGDGGE